MSRPRGKMKGESDLSYAIAMLNFHKHPMNRRAAGDNSRVKAAEKRVLDLGGKEALYGIQAREQARKQAIRNKRSQLAPRKGPVQRMPQRPSTLGKLFKGASTKPKGGFLKALGASPLIKKPPPNQFKKFTPKKLVPKPRQPSVTSRYRGGSGKKKYNQAAYFAGLGVNPNTKQNQGIYKPYANGGGVRKPKYKE